MVKPLDVLYKAIMGSLTTVVIVIYLLSLVGMEFYPFSIIFGCWILLSIVASIIIGLYRFIKWISCKNADA